MTAGSSTSRSFRPSFAVYRRYLDRFDGRGGRIIIWIVPAVIVLSTLDGLSNRGLGIWLPITTTVTFAAAGLYLLLFFRREHISVSPGHLEIRDALGRVREYGAAELSRTVIMPTYLVPMRYTTMLLSRTVVLDSRGKPALSWLSSNWSLSEMRELAAVLALPTDEVHATMDAGDLRKRYPHSVRWWVAHVYLTALIISGGIVVLAGIAIAIDIAVTGG